MTSLLLEGSLLILWVCIVCNGKIVFALQILEKAIQLSLGGHIPLTQKTGVCALNCIIILCILCSFFFSFLRLMKSVKKNKKSLFTWTGILSFSCNTTVWIWWISTKEINWCQCQESVKNMALQNYWPSDVWGSVKIHHRKQWCAEHHLTWTASHRNAPNSSNKQTGIMTNMDTDGAK